MIRRVGASGRFWRFVTAVAAAVAAIAGSFAYAGLTPSFVGEPASSFVVDRTPAVVVNTVLDLLGPLAQPLSFLFALAVLAAALAAVVLVCLEVEAAADVQYLSVPLVAAAVWLVATVTTGDAVGAVAAAAPAALAVGAVGFAAANDPLSVRRERTPDRSKRATLRVGVAVLSLSGLSYLAGRRRTPDESVPRLDGSGVAAADGNSPEERLLESAESDAFDLPDAPGLVSRIGEFYTVDINSIDPIVEEDDWTLSITGAVDSEVEVDYDELREMSADRFYSTLRCVGEDLNDREMDNAVWTGVPVADLLADAGVDGEHAVVRAVDDYWNTITVEDLSRSYLVYGMNGRVLPREHGHPVRLIVPGNWGEVNVKWIEEIEIVEEDVDGYWEERGWDGTGEVRTVAKLWSVDRSDGEVTVGGHAYAGRRGVDRVEVSVDGGDTWTDADLSPEPSADLDERDVWRQWRHTFEPTAGEHEVVVRAVDGDGTLQPEERSSSKPDGASGWVSRTIEA